MNSNVKTDAGPLSHIRRNSTKQAVNVPLNTIKSTTNVFGKFFDRPNYSLDSLEYAREGDDPGLVLIFNQENFEHDTESREGSTKDVNDIVTCFGRLGFNIKEENVFEDLLKEELFLKVDEILNSDLSQYNSVLVFILSHGSYCNIIQARRSSFKLEDLLEKFGKCDALKGKPKLFVIQACKGNETTLSSTDTGDRQIVPLSTFEESYPDMIIIYSTLEGKCAFRDTKLGTWLIQEVCRNFTAFGRRDDVLSLSTRVVKCICTNYYQSTPGGEDVQKQIPVVVSTLSRKFYLNRNKDRDFTLRSTAIMNDIHYNLKAVSEKMEKFSIK